MKLWRTIYLSAAVAVTANSLLANDEITVRDLTDAESAAMDEIQEGRVLATVSFLSADEMAGRNTPSRELDIACAYVAARFRGAGLEGLGPDGSFYQTHTLTLTSPPRSQITLRLSDGSPVANLGALSGGPADMDLGGTLLSESDAKQREQIEGIVVLDDLPVPPQALDQPLIAIAACSRRIRQFTDAGASAILIKCSEDSILPEVANALAATPLMPPRGLSLSCPVLLVRADAELSGQTMRMKVPAQITTERPVRNVIGMLRGSDSELTSETILITAHLDHIGLAVGGPDPVNNGADDNATGVTAVLSLADAFAALKQRPKRSVVFMTFWGEEKGLQGSREFVKQPLLPLDQIVANINIEMVGRPEEDARGKAWMTGWTHSNLGPLMNAGSIRAGVEIFNRTDVGEMLYSRSDNYSFVNAGVVAHSFSAGSLHADYHQPGDEWTKLEIPHMTKVIRGLFAGALPLAEGELTPHATEAP